MRVLITDSDKPFLEMEIAYLQKCGFEVVAATDGQECRELLREFTPDVLVLDCELAWAMRIAKEMQLSQTHSSIPAILISDSNLRDSFQNLLPPAAWFRKPFSLGDLQQKIASLCPKPLVPNMFS